MGINFLILLLCLVHFLTLMRYTQEINDYESELDAVWKMYDEEEKEKEEYRKECLMLQAKVEELDAVIKKSLNKPASAGDIPF